MSDLYILDGKIPKPCDDVLQWAEWFENKQHRRVAEETIGDSRISTIFLGLDHSFGEPVPILWETMVFGGLLDEEQDRCSGSWEDAEAMHRRMVERVMKPIFEEISNEIKK